MNTQEGNKLIAEFMGLDVLYEDSVHHETADKLKVTKMKYHTSWDWFLPVWAVFLKKAAPLDVNESRSIYRDNIRWHIGYCDLQEAYEGLIEEIEWYNLVK